jgi:hypothetical protein
LTFGVIALHDFNLDTKDTLAEQDVSHGIVNEVSRGLTGVDHESIGKFHRLGTGSTKLAGNNHLATLCTRLHDEAKDTVACPADSETTKELVSQALTLSNSRKTTVLYFLGVKLKRVFGELETLLDECSQLPDAAALLTKDLLGVCGTDDNLSTGVGDTDITSRVTLLRKFASEEFVEFSAEYTVSYELALFADLSGHIGDERMS